MVPGAHACTSPLAGRCPSSPNRASCPIGDARPDRQSLTFSTLRRHIDHTRRIRGIRCCRRRLLLGLAAGIPPPRAGHPKAFAVLRAGIHILQNPRSGRCRVRLHFAMPQRLLGSTGLCSHRSYAHPAPSSIPDNSGYAASIEPYPTLVGAMVGLQWERATILPNRWIAG